MKFQIYMKTFNAFTNLEKDIKNFQEMTAIMFVKLECTIKSSVLKVHVHVIEQLALIKELCQLNIQRITVQ